MTTLRAQIRAPPASQEMKQKYEQKVRESQNSQYEGAAERMDAVSKSSTVSASMIS